MVQIRILTLLSEGSCNWEGKFASYAQIWLQGYFPTEGLDDFLANVKSQADSACVDGACRRQLTEQSKKLSLIYVWYSDPRIFHGEI